MRYRNIEVNCLMNLLSSTINQRIAPAPVRAVDWRELYYIAEFHRITNISYYSVLGVSENVPDVWVGRFAKIFKKWTSIDTSQQKDTAAVLDALEEYKIEYMVMKDWMMKRYYPQPEMRAVENIGILIKPKQEKAIHRMMQDLGYRREGEDEDGIMSFYRDVNFSFVFSEQLFPHNPKFASYYRKLWKRLQSAVGYGYRRAFSLEDEFIYYMADTCDLYARGEADARHVVDLYLYLKKYKSKLDWSYIDLEFAKLEIGKIAKCLIDVGDMWLGVYEGDKAGDSRDVEEYIWTKGAYGKETSARIMPMILDMELWQIREVKKKRRLRILRWFFPKASHMENRFPSIRKLKFLLPFFWVIRWFTLIWFFGKLQLIKIHRNLSRKANEEQLNKAIVKGLPKDED